MSQNTVAPTPQFTPAAVLRRGSPVQPAETRRKGPSTTYRWASSLCGYTPKAGDDSILATFAAGLEREESGKVFPGDGV